MSGASPLPRMSLARKLALLTGTVIAASLLVVLWVAYAILTSSAVERSREGLSRSTHELATLVETSLRQSRGRYSAIAHRASVQRLLQRGSAATVATGPLATDSLTAAAQKVLAELSTPNDSGLPIELWNASGQRVALVGTDEPIMPELGGDATVLGAPRIPRTGIHEVAAADSLQLGRLYSSGNRIYLWFVMPVIDRGKAIGFIAHQRRVSANPQADRSIRALAGQGVSSYYRNQDGSIWTTLSGTPVSPPRQRLNDSTRAEGPQGEELIFAEEHISGTPLDIVMVRSIGEVLAAPRTTLRRLLIVALLLLLAGTGAALFIGRSVARPIGIVAQGAEAIARGHYDTRVPTEGDAEIARLAESFNHMAGEVSRAQRALEQQTADARAANRAKSEFLATMSHELRTPLNAIAGYAELMEMGLRGPLTDDQKRDLSRIRSSGQHLLGLISSMLDLNRIERGQLAYDLTSIELGPFLADLDALVSPQATAKSLTVMYVPTHPGLSVRADREKLRQIILNLLSNAIRFTPAGGRITLSASPLGDDRVEIHVEDTGPGIPENRREHVFEPFVQLDRSLTQSHGGLGLGLAISRDLARGMKGDLAVDPASRSGARFVLTLPAAPRASGTSPTTTGERRAAGRV